MISKSRFGHLKSEKQANLELLASKQELLKAHKSLIFVSICLKGFVISLEKLATKIKTNFFLVNSIFGHKFTSNVTNYPDMLFLNF